jgi:outer membrane protein OmpA-like peptidoglycan-associated protein
MKIFSLLFSFLLIFNQSCSVAQQGYGTKNKKAIKLYEQARAHPNQHVNVKSGTPDFHGAIDLLNKALERDNNFLEAHQLIGELYRITNNPQKAVEHFKRALEINPGSNLGGVLFLDIAELQLKNGDFEDAIKYLDIVLNNRHRAITDELAYAADKMRKNAQFALDAKRNPKKINPINIGPGINTEHPEYFPTITVDGRTLLFTREVPIQGAPKERGRGRGQEDFFVSQLSEKNVWLKATPMPSNINTPLNEGAPTLSADGRSLIFVACADETGYNYGPNREGMGSCDLFYTKRIGSQWMNPKNLPGKVNTGNWETQPSLSADGKTLYFIRRVGRPGSQRSDIYVSRKDDDGNWGAAERLPDNINTSMMETSVQIHPDGRTLYFSSNGHVGLGGFDIYMSRMDAKGKWGNPINLGYPINTENDENSLLVGPDGEIAFFASDRPGGYGDLDIYYFILPQEFRPIPTTYFEGIVYDIDTKKPLGGKFKLIDLSTGDLVIDSEADQITGEFLVALPTSRTYALNVEYPNYAFFSKNFDLTELAEGLESYKMDVPMVPLGSEGTITLANVFFDLNKSTLRPESYIELNKLVEFLNKNGSVKIEIGGHTDSRGNAVANQKLSEDRAQAVYNYLIEKGIDKKRLAYKGYGQSQPKITDEAIAKLATEKEREAAHQSNRRTEYKILK